MTATQSELGDTADAQTAIEPDTVRRTIDDLIHETVGSTHDGELLNFDPFCAVRSEAADAVRVAIEQEVEA